MASWVENFQWLVLLRATLLLLAGWLIAHILGSAARRLAKRYAVVKETLLIQRMVFYAVFAISVVTSLQELGFNLGALLGAAGILTVALGFASQTSASNLISGLFLIGERTFVVGDTIRVGNTTGEVLSVDLLSVKLRTPDNLFVRLPNEALIKAEITNLTRFPVRRLDLKFGVAYEADMQVVESVLRELAGKNAFSLQDKAPVFIFDGFSDSAMNIQFSVWAKREDFLALRNSIQYEIKQAFDAEGIEIPYPHQVVHLSNSGPAG